MNAASLDQIDNAGRLLCSYDYKDMEGLVTVSSIIYHVLFYRHTVMSLLWCTVSDVHCVRVSSLFPHSSCRFIAMITSLFRSINLFSDLYEVIKNNNKDYPTRNKFI